VASKPGEEFFTDLVVDDHAANGSMARASHHRLGVAIRRLGVAWLGRADRHPAPRQLPAGALRVYTPRLRERPSAPTIMAPFLRREVSGNRAEAISSQVRWGKEAGVDVLV
jgi:hypothetical protein